MFDDTNAPDLEILTFLLVLLPGVNVLQCDKILATQIELPFLSQ